MNSIISFRDIINTHANSFVSDCIQNGFHIDKNIRSSKQNVYKIGLVKDSSTITVTIINRDYEIQVKRYYDIKSTGHRNKMSFIYKKMNDNNYVLKGY